jgi:hypothetical protein
VTGHSEDSYQDAETVLRLAAGGDADAVVSTLDSVLDRSGMSGVYRVAVCLAATMVGDAALGGPWTLDFPEIDEAGYDTRWVARFVSSYVNADPSTGQALFGSALADGQLPNCLLTLAGSTLATLRRRVDPVAPVAAPPVAAPPPVTTVDT